MELNSKGAQYPEIQYVNSKFKIYLYVNFVIIFFGILIKKYFF